VGVVDELEKIEKEVQAEAEGLSFEDENLKITILEEDGVRIPAGQLFYRFESDFIVGEITYCHALVTKREVDKKGNVKNKTYETIVPVLVWGYYSDGEIAERSLKPYQMARKLEVQSRPVLVELGTRYAGTLETLISLDAAKRFVKGENSQGWKELFQEVKSSLEKFVSFPWDPRLYDVVACWILGTYFSEMFSTFPFLYAYGSQGSGKSRLVITAVYLSRHGFMATDPSDASLFRMAEAFRPTLGIDESLLGKSAWKIARTAFKRGMSVPRVEKTSKEEFLLALFETYMPIAFASTERPSELGGSEADEARALFIFMQRAPDPSGRDPEKWEFKDLRDRLYLLRLTRAKDVLDALSLMEKSDLNLYGHDREVWLPILTIASLIDREVYNHILEYAAELGAIKQAFQYQEEKLITRAILLYFRDQYRQALQKDPKAYISAIEFKASQLLEYVRLALEEQGEYDEGGFQKYWTSRRIGRLLTKMSLFRRWRSGIHHYVVSAKKLQELYKRYWCGVFGVLGVLKKERVSQKENTPKAEDNQEASRGVLDSYLTPFKINTPNTPNTPSCEICGSPNAKAFTREDGVHYLCDKCLADWEGDL